jgi:alpha-acetolactate decarboxylase
MLDILLAVLLVSTALAPGVKTYGELRALMHQGDVAGKVGLAAVLQQPHTYGVGALSELRGEVTILDGIAWIAYSESDGKARVERVTKSDEQAALLVISSVARWKRVTLPKPIPFADLDAALEAIARANGIDADQPFPFSVSGPVEDLDFHVVDGRKLPAGGGSHQDHVAAGSRFTKSKASATLIGFFSKSHQGVFTHMGSNTHIHVVLPKERASGHVDKVTLPRGTTLLVPR